MKLLIIDVTATVIGVLVAVGAHKLGGLSYEYWGLGLAASFGAGAARALRILTS